ncbi:MAG: hypothetical protein AAGB46_07665 [Verrucomicrobiota bacterium]
MAKRSDIYSQDRQRSRSTYRQRRSEDMARIEEQRSETARANFRGMGREQAGQVRGPIARVEDHSEKPDHKRRDGYDHRNKHDYKHRIGHNHHYYHDRKLHFYHGRWYRHPLQYYTRRHQSRFFFFIDLGDCYERNVPTYVYEEHIHYDSPPTSVFESSAPIDQAYAAFAKGSYFQAIVDFNRAIRRDHDNGLLYLARAQAYFSTKDYHSAYDDLIKGMELIPEWTEVSFNMRELYNREGDFEQQLDALERWVEEYPRDYKVHFVLGYMYFYLQEYESAKTELAYVLAWDENHEQGKKLLEHIYTQEAETDLYH